SVECEVAIVTIRPGGEAFGDRLPTGRGIRPAPAVRWMTRRVPMTSLSLLLVGAAVGVLSGMLGIGGGIVLVPALVLLFGLSQTEAQGTSLATIPFGAIIAAVIYNQSTPLRVSMVVAVGTGFVVGALLGAKLLPHVPEAALRSGFGCLLLYLGLLFVFDLK